MPERQNHPADVVTVDGVGAEMLQFHDMNHMNLEALACGKSLKDLLRLVRFPENDALTGLSAPEAHRTARDVTALLEKQCGRCGKGKEVQRLSGPEARRRSIG